MYIIIYRIFYNKKIIYFINYKISYECDLMHISHIKPPLKIRLKEHRNCVKNRYINNSAVCWTRNQIFYFSENNKKMLITKWSWLLGKITHLENSNSLVIFQILPCSPKFRFRFFNSLSSSPTFSSVFLNFLPHSHWVKPLLSSGLLRLHHTYGGYLASLFPVSSPFRLWP